MDKNSTYRLSNGVEIPCIGFGMWQTPDTEVGINAVKSAIEAGYTHIDTAQAYGNEDCARVKHRMKWLITAGSRE